jgi:hypothetical protein
MKACVSSTIPARSIQRISSALAQYSPATIVRDARDADVVVHIVIGVGNFIATPIDQLIAQEVKNGQRYAIIQCCLMSTEQPRPDFWKPLWEGADAVWSYLDLRAFAPTYQFNFHYAPLGVDPIFYDRKVTRDITMLTTGYVAESEGVREVSEAVKRVGGKHVHVGPNFQLGDHSQTYFDVNDELMAHLYSRSHYVAGLRRDEGLACGARPIMFDASHYRQWFDGHAEYVPEDSFDVVTAAIESIVQFPPLVSETEVTWASKRFNWPMVVGQFWEMITTQPKHKELAYE